MTGDDRTRSGMPPESRAAGAARDDLLLEIRDLEVRFPLREGTVRAVDGASLEVRRGRTLGVIGESGSGKSVMAQAILRLTPPPGVISAGEILLHHPPGMPATTLDLTRVSASGPEIRAIRWNDISMVFQEPMTSFSPVHTIGDQITEAILLHDAGCTRAAARHQAVELLNRAGLPNAASLIDSWPFQLSGGMRQRAMIAMALACRPRLLIADEPTTALDVTIEAQILALIKTLQADYHMAVMFITHDLAVIGEMSDEVVVMYLGQVMERGPVERIFEEPLHPYTHALWNSVPTVDGELRRLESIVGVLPGPYEARHGCPFFSRCSLRIEGLCDRKLPPLVEVTPGHSARCVLYEDAPEQGNR